MSPFGSGMMRWSLVAAGTIPLAACDSKASSMLDMPWHFRARSPLLADPAENYIGPKHQ